MGHFTVFFTSSPHLDQVQIKIKLIKSGLHCLRGAADSTAEEIQFQIFETFILTVIIQKGAISPLFFMSRPHENKVRSKTAILKRGKSRPQ